MNYKKIFILVGLLVPQFIFCQISSKELENGNKLFNRKEYSKAILCYEEYLKGYPNNKIALYNLALAKYKNDDFNDAIVLFKKVLEFSAKTNAELAMVYYNLGVVLIKYKQLNEAICFFKTSLKFNSNNKFCKENLQLALNEQKKVQDMNSAAGNTEKDTDLSKIKFQDNSTTNKSMLSIKQLNEQYLNSLLHEDIKKRDSISGKYGNIKSGLKKDW